ncbi:MAG: hypothetical protein KAR20_07780 [Candidatus Heimdallarchaeota archaeon]|nr:hypothetical protein [Candidatus Heimdallarchaeota archaeon]
MCTELMKSREIQIALIAALSAIGGALISQIATYVIARLNRKHQNNIHLRQKYEEMLHHFYKSLQWIPQLNECITRSQISAFSESPEARHALSLCLLYFEELIPFVNNYIHAQRSYYVSIVKLFDDSCDISAGTQAFMHKSHKPMMDDIIKNKEAFDDEALRIAKEYTLDPFE